MTVQEILKKTGLTDEQISALDAKIMDGLGSVLTTAETAQADAAEKLRLQEALYKDEIVPALNGWGNEKATLMAERDFYKTQAEGAKGAGFLPKDAPSFTPNPNPNPNPNQPHDPATGRFVPGANPVPGSPGYIPGDQVITAVSNVSWIMSEHQRLHGSPMPDDFETILKEATSNRMSVRDYAARKYKFEEKKAEMVALKQKEHDDRIVKDTEARIHKEYAERGSSNPNVRTAQQSQYATVRKAVDEGKVKDPLKMSPEERRQQTNTMIHADIAENAVA